MRLWLSYLRRRGGQEHRNLLRGGSLAASGNAAAAEATTAEQGKMQPHLAAGVQMQFMRPGQLEAAGRKFPVVYVPLGLIE